MADEKHLAPNYLRRNKASEAGCHSCHGCHCCNHWHYHYCWPIYIWPNTYPGQVHQYPHQVIYQQGSTVYPGVYTQGAAAQPSIMSYNFDA